MPIELVVFDMAGTTVFDGDAVSSCFRASLAAAGVQVTPEATHAVMGLPKPEAIRRLLHASGRVDCSATEVDEIHRHFVGRMKHYYAHDPAVREVPGASATFSALRQAGLKVALNTGFSRDIVDVLFDRLGWGPSVIDASVTSDEVARGRPHPDMIRHLMRRLGVDDPSRVAKVGDTPVDLEEGTNAGCGLVIGVTTGRHTRPQLEARLHIHILDSVAELPALLHRLFTKS